MKITTTLDQATFRPFAITIDFKYEEEALCFMEALEAAVRNGVCDEIVEGLIKAVAKGLQPLNVSTII